MNAAQLLHNSGQSLWLDNITRQLLGSGQLARYIDQASVTGLTSNPTIFARAILDSPDYDQEARQLAESGARDEDIFFTLAIADLRRAALLFQPIWEATQGRDGWVSLEASPRLAHDSAATVKVARDLHKLAAIPNLFIKVPGTREGLQAIEELVLHGVPLNITLLFSDVQYLAAAGAYQRGLERRRAAGLDLGVASVASLFVSRWDHSTTEHLPVDLRDELGIAMARRAYRSFRGVLRSAHWKELEAAGARPQRLLFASTGTKSQTRSDTYYLEALGAPDTINTIPQPTLDAFIDHGRLGEPMTDDGADADEVIARVAAAGIDVPECAARLQAEGADAFVRSWEDLMLGIDSKASQLAGETRG